MNAKSVLGRAAIFAFAGSLTFIFLIDLCDVIFQCGCRPLWAGADIACNIHTPGAKHCPWCSHGAIAYYGVLALVLIPQLLVSFWPVRWDWRIRTALVVLLFPVIGTLTGIVMGLLDGYWI